MNNELLSIMDYLERDRGLDREILKEVIEESLITAARKAVGPVADLRVNLDAATGEITAIAKMMVVEEVADPEAEISLEAALKIQEDAKVGTELEWEVTPTNFGRIAAQSAKQGILQRLRQAEKDRIREEYKNRLGEILYGSVTRLERGNVIVNFGRAEGVVRHQDRVPNEDYQLGDHICCILVEVNLDQIGPILVVSRSSPDLVKALFTREVAEISENIVIIKKVAREPGYRSKLAVDTTDPKVDPVGACVGIRGSRVKAIVRELNGEKVDIIRWDADLRTFIANSLQPAKIGKMEIDEEDQRVTINVDNDQLSLAIGKHGQNVRLTRKLTGWKIDIGKAEEKQQIQFEERVQQAIDALAGLEGIDIETAQTLVNNGFLSIEGIRAAEIADLIAIEEFDDAKAEAIKSAVTDDA